MMRSRWYLQDSALEMIWILVQLQWGVFTQKHLSGCSDSCSFCAEACAICVRPVDDQRGASKRLGMHPDRRQQELCSTTRQLQGGRSHHLYRGRDQNITQNIYSFRSCCCCDVASQNMDFMKEPPFFTSIHLHTQQFKQDFCQSHSTAESIPVHKSLTAHHSNVLCFLHETYYASLFSCKPEVIICVVLQ